MGFDHWDELRTAYHVARLGTVSGAAGALNVHHATVIRHVDALEARLGTKLFQRHARGYTPTEAGHDLLVTAGQVDDQFAQLIGRLKGQQDDVTGELIVTTVDEFGALLLPILKAFMERHPELRVRLLSDPRRFRLEYGEAHVAIRAGAKPSEPDNIVQPFFTHQMRLVASKAYFAKHGPIIDGTWSAHRFVGSSDPTPRPPFYRWMAEHVPSECIKLRVTSMNDGKHAIRAGLGIGFIAAWDRDGTADLVDVIAPLEVWRAPTWLVTHVDLHRTAKVQSFLKFLKQRARSWERLQA